MMKIGLYDLGNDIVLKQRPPQRVRKELVLITYAQQEACKPGVVEIELRAFDDPLIEISMMRWERESDKARLEDRNPPSRCVYGNAAIRCEGRVVQ
jgi:hypothetical protein